MNISSKNILRSKFKESTCGVFQITAAGITTKELI